MARSHNSTITCLHCDGTGAQRGQTCPICGGVPEIDYAAFYALAVRVDGLLSQNLKVRREVDRELKKMKLRTRDTDRIVAQYLRTMEGQAASVNSR
jgi:hypothetical protein